MPLRNFLYTSFIRELAVFSKSIYCFLRIDKTDVMGASKNRSKFRASIGLESSKCDARKRLATSALLISKIKIYDASRDETHESSVVRLNILFVVPSFNADNLTRSRV